MKEYITKFIIFSLVLFLVMLATIDLENPDRWKMFWIGYFSVEAMILFIEAGIDFAYHGETSQRVIKLIKSLF